MLSCGTAFLTVSNNLQVLHTSATSDSSKVQKPSVSDVKKSHFFVNYLYHVQIVYIWNTSPCSWGLYGKILVAGYLQEWLLWKNIRSCPYVGQSQVAVGSNMSPLPAKAKHISNVATIYLRKSGSCVREEWEKHESQPCWYSDPWRSRMHCRCWRRCLCSLWRKSCLKRIVPLQPMEDHGGEEIHTAAQAEPMMSWQDL